MASLFDSVVEGTYGAQYESYGVSSDVDAELENYITDDPYTVASYTSQCFEGMLAADAVMYAIEGKCSVKYLTATDESAKQEAVASMEASLRGAWESIKDYASRAWEAVKKFIKKIWGKLKGYASMVKTFFKKYRQLLASGKGDNAPVMWGVVKPQAALDQAQVWLDHVDKDAETTKNQVLAEIRDNHGKKPPVNSAAERNWQEFRDQLYTAVWGNESGYDPKQTTFSKVKATAIKVADMGFDKYLQGFLKLGETKQKEFYASYKKLESQAGDNADDADADDNAAAKAIFTLQKKTFHRAIKIIQECVRTYNEAANKMYSQSVKACRVAMRYSHGDKTATGVESYTDFNAMMAEIL